MLFDIRALTPMTTSRLRAMAPRARSTLARLRSCNSPPGAMPVRAILTRQRPICGAPRATAATSSMLSAQPEPASTQQVTPSCRHIGGPSLLRPAWVWMSIRPGAAILPPAIATSRVASSPNRGIDDAPTLDDQFVAHLRECARGMDERRGGCDGSGQKLAPVHHGQFLPTLFGSLDGPCLEACDELNATHVTPFGMGKRSE